MAEQQQITEADKERFNAEANALIEYLQSRGLNNDWGPVICAHVAGQMVALSAETYGASTAQRHEQAELLAQTLHQAAQWQLPRSN